MPKQRKGAEREGIDFDELKADLNKEIKRRIATGKPVFGLVIEKAGEREQAKEPEEDKPPMCAAPVGNSFWKARSSHGRKPIFPTPEALWEACCEYFQWNDDNPLYEAKVCSYQGVNTLEQLPKMRAMTVSALCLFLDIERSTWQNYCSREDFMAITARVEDYIYHQKFTGASADLLNANIIARDLGLREKNDTQITGQVTMTITPEDAGIL